LEKGKKKFATDGFVPLDTSKYQAIFNQQIKYPSIFLQQTNSGKFIEESNKLSILIVGDKNKIAGSIKIHPTHLLNSQKTFFDGQTKLDYCPDKNANLFYTITLVKDSEIFQDELRSEMASSPHLCNLPLNETIYKNVASSAPKPQEPPGNPKAETRTQGPIVSLNKLYNKNSQKRNSQEFGPQGSINFGPKPIPTPKRDPPSTGISENLIRNLKDTLLTNTGSANIKITPRSGRIDPNNMGNPRQNSSRSNSRQGSRNGSKNNSRSFSRQLSNVKINYGSNVNNNNLPQKLVP
jgi:hypothetical protein